MHRRLYCIRNVGKKKALRRSVLETPAIEVAFVMPANAKELEEYTTIDDLSIPSYANTKEATRELRANLLSILSGKDERWHLWEVVLYEDSISLHYADKHASGKAATNLSLNVSWAKITKIDIKVSAHVRLSDFQVICICPDDQHCELIINYDDVMENLHKMEIHTCRPRTPLG
jgi:hypothetical protein